MLRQCSGITMNNFLSRDSISLRTKMCTSCQTSGSIAILQKWTMKFWWTGKRISYRELLSILFTDNYCFRLRNDQGKNPYKTKLGIRRKEPSLYNTQLLFATTRGQMYYALILGQLSNISNRYDSYCFKSNTSILQNIPSYCQFQKNKLRMFERND